MKFTKVIKSALTLTLCCGALMLLSACHEEAKAQMVSDAAAFCQNFKDMDFQAMYDLTHDKTAYFNDIYVPGAEGSEILFKSMADKLEYEIGECEIDGKNASVSAHLSNVDMNVAMGDVLNDYFERCEADPDNIDSISIDEIIDEHVNAEDAQRRDADTVFNFIKQDGKWVLESNVMIYDDVTGGYMSYYFQANMAVDSNFSTENTETTTK